MTITELQDRLTKAAAELDAIADDSEAIADSVLNDVLGVTAFKFRKAALALRETLARLLAKYEKELTTSR